MSDARRQVLLAGILYGALASRAAAQPAKSNAECRLFNKLTAFVGLGFPRPADRMKALGDVRIAVVFVDFSDAPATRTPQQVFAMISPKAE